MTPNRYEEVRLPSGAVATVKESARRLLGEVGVIVFDCDGTLVDVRDSYDRTILETVNRMTNGFGRKARGFDDLLGKRLILKIRQTGGFNSDWDVTYALCLFVLVADSGANGEASIATTALGSSARTDRRGDGEAERCTRDRLTELVEDFSSSPRLDGWRSVDSFLEERRPKDASRLKAFRMYLGYPGDPFKSRMALSFDETYYGDGLFERIYGRKPTGPGRGRGLIENEKLLITREQLELVARTIGGSRMAISTGRTYVSAQHTLGPLLDVFRRDASVFIGDGDIYPDLASELRHFRKPSGDSLTFAREQLGGKVLLYIGDSGEDRLMVDDARKKERKLRALFAGVYGTAHDTQNQRSFFLGNGTDLVIESVGQLGEVLVEVRT